jgi:hypothetical protein
MLTITIQSYDESADAFKCTAIPENLLDCAFDMPIAASLMPYIASEECDECEDLPFGLVGKTFSLTR